MKSTFKFAFAIITTSIFILNSCKKDNNAEPDPTPPVTETEDVPLTDAQLAFLETVKDTVIRLEDIILEDGQNVRSYLEKNDPAFLQTYPSRRGGNTTGLTPRLQKNTFLARMMAMGNYLVDRSRHTYPSAGAGNPAQSGLAYSWGSKDYDKRQTPPGVTGECKDLKIYGLDCSGMIWAMTQASSLPPVVPKYNFFVKEITNAEKWTQAFKASADYKDLKMKDMKQLPKDKMKNGDIILWGSHVGIYLYGYFYQSNGTSKSPGCNNNLVLSRGPRCISLEEVLGYGLGSYKVFRATYGEDYTLTLALKYTGLAATSPFCMLGEYMDTTVINITITANDSVVLNYINNYTPKVIYKSTLGGCDCLGMSFTNGSVIEYTAFRATFDGNILVYDLTSTWCSPTDRFQCDPDPPGTLPGLVIPGNVESGNLDMPRDPVESIEYPWGGNGTLTIKHIL